MITILHLYPNHLNTYGDTGNILALKRRLEWREIDCQIIEHNPNDEMPTTVDIIFGGGGQDSNQQEIEDDFKKNASKLQSMLESGTPALFICGSYQLIGAYFKTKTGEKIEGSNLLDFYTEGGEKRLIGNIVLESEQFGTIVGYENHSGQTYIKGLSPLGAVVKGFGNNENDKQEGVLYKNAICTYLHGPILPKNPQIADFLIKKALENQGINDALKKLDDTIEYQAQKQAKMRNN